MSCPTNETWRRKSFAIGLEKRSARVACPIQLRPQSGLDSAVAYRVRCVATPLRPRKLNMRSAILPAPVPSGSTCPAIRNGKSNVASFPATIQHLPCRVGKTLSYIDRIIVADLQAREYPRSAVGYQTRQIKGWSARGRPVCPTHFESDQRYNRSFRRLVP